MYKTGTSNDTLHWIMESWDVNDYADHHLKKAFEMKAIINFLDGLDSILCTSIKFSVSEPCQLSKKI